jgi:hypothetical protein
MSGTSRDATKSALKSQYHAGLAMLRQAVDECPDELWEDDTPTNAFWQIAYHALFFVHLYLLPRLEDFAPWPGHQSNVQHGDGIAGPPDPASDLPLIPDPYSRAEVLAYCDFCDRMIDEAVNALDLGSPESGFDWYSMPKLEDQLVNLRHMQHHTAQLADRLRNGAGLGVRWVGKGSAAGRG